MAPVSHSTSACASSVFAPPTNKIGAMGTMVPEYFSMTDLAWLLYIGTTEIKPNPNPDTCRWPAGPEGPAHRLAGHGRHTQRACCQPQAQCRLAYLLL